MTDEPQEQEEQPIPVRVLHTEGRSSLVEVKGPRRYYVPVSKIVDGCVTAETLGKAVEYGIRWESFLDLSGLTVEGLAQLLREKGIWTADDLRRFDRKLIRIGTNIIGKAVQDAAHRAETHKLPRRKRNG